MDILLSSHKRNVILYRLTNCMNKNHNVNGLTTTLDKQQDMADATLGMVVCKNLHCGSCCAIIPCM